jgi:hypothetical protein
VLQVSFIPGGCTRPNFMACNPPQSTPTPFPTANPSRLIFHFNCLHLPLPMRVLASSCTLRSSRQHSSPALSSPASDFTRAATATWAKLKKTRLLRTGQKRLLRTRQPEVCAPSGFASARALRFLHPATAIIYFLCFFVSLFFVSLLFLQ